jgi:hypothetical protein
MAEKLWEVTRELDQKITRLELRSILLSGRWGGFPEDSVALQKEIGDLQTEIWYLIGRLPDKDRGTYSQKVRLVVLRGKEWLRQTTPPAKNGKKMFQHLKLSP